jgi:hypothetical protein
VRGAIQQLDQQGRVHHIPSRDERLAAIAREYAKDPEETLVVSPDNQSRQEINQIIHGVMQAAGYVDHREQRVRLLVARQEITGADRQWATQYEHGDLVRYTTGSKGLALRSGEYARVEDVHAKQNLVTVTREDGQQITYDPRRLQGVTLYCEVERVFAVGDRVQTTAPYPERRVANRELGRIEQIDAEGHLRLRLDSGRVISFDVAAYPHLDYGYAVTSHSSQGQTADRVLVHVDTERGGEHLINRRLAYVALSRGRYDAQLYTNDRVQLAEGLGRDVSHRSAIEPGRAAESGTQKQEPSASRSQAAQLTTTQ